MSSEEQVTREVIKYLVRQAVEISEGARVELAESAGNISAQGVATVSIACSLAAIAILINGVVCEGLSVTTWESGRGS